MDLHFSPSRSLKHDKECNFKVIALVGPLRSYSLASIDVSEPIISENI